MHSASLTPNQVSRLVYRLVRLKPPGEPFDRKNTPPGSLPVGDSRFGRESELPLDPSWLALQFFFFFSRTDFDDSRNGFNCFVYDRVVQMELEISIAELEPGVDCDMALRIFFINPYHGY